MISVKRYDASATKEKGQPVVRWQGVHAADVMQDDLVMTIVGPQPAVAITVFDAPWSEASQEYVVPKDLCVSDDDDEINLNKNNSRVDASFKVSGHHAVRCRNWEENEWVFGASASPAWERVPRDNRNTVVYVHIEMPSYEEHSVRCYALLHIFRVPRPTHPSPPSLPPLLPSFKIVPWDSLANAPAHSVVAEPWDGYTRDPALLGATCRGGCPWPHKWTAMEDNGDDDDDEDDEEKKKQTKRARKTFRREWTVGSFNPRSAKELAEKRIAARNEPTYELLYEDAQCETHLADSSVHRRLVHISDKTPEQCGAACTESPLCIAFTLARMARKQYVCLPLLQSTLTFPLTSSLTPLLFVFLACITPVHFSYIDCKLLLVSSMQAQEGQVMPPRVVGEPINVPRKAIRSYNMAGWSDERCWVRVNPLRSKQRY